MEKRLSFQRESCVQRHPCVRGVAEIRKKKSLRGREGGRMTTTVNKYVGGR